MESFETKYKIETLEEIQDNLERYYVILRDLESGYEFSDVFNELFRIVHSVKGNATSAGFAPFATLVHKLENKLIAYKDNKIVYSSHWVQMLALCLSTFQETVDKLKVDLNTPLDFHDIEVTIESFDGKKEIEEFDVSEKKTLNFLVVDDEVEITDSIEDGLRFSFDCEVTKVHDGQNALDLCSQHLYDIIITDFKMPKINGLKFIELLREGGSLNSNTPIVFASGFNPDLTPSVRLWENVFILKKPFQSKRLEFLVKCARKLAQAS